VGIRIFLLKNFISMLIQSPHHFYIHENKSKYLFSLHPLITAFYLAYERQSPEMLQKIKDTYSLRNCLNCDFWDLPDFWDKSHEYTKPFVSIRVISG